MKAIPVFTVLFALAHFVGMAYADRSDSVRKPVDHPPEITRTLSECRHLAGGR